MKFELSSDELPSWSGQIVVESGTIRGQRASFSRNKDTIILGRDPSCDLVFDATGERMVSRKHLEVSVKPDGVYLADLHTYTGTFVNGHPMGGTMQLGPMTRVQVGQGGPEITIFVSPPIENTQVQQSERTAVLRPKGRGRRSQPGKLKQQQVYSEQNHEAGPLATRLSRHRAVPPGASGSGGGITTNSTTVLKRRAVSGAAGGRRVSREPEGAHLRGGQNSSPQRRSERPPIQAISLLGRGGANPMERGLPSGGRAVLEQGKGVPPKARSMGEPEVGTDSGWYDQNGAAWGGELGGPSTGPTSKPTSEPARRDETVKLNLNEMGLGKGRPSSSTPPKRKGQPPAQRARKIGETSLPGRNSQSTQAFMAEDETSQGWPDVAPSRRPVRRQGPAPSRGPSRNQRSTATLMHGESPKAPLATLPPQREERAFDPQGWGLGTDEDPTVGLSGVPHAAPVEENDGWGDWGPEDWTDLQEDNPTRPVPMQVPVEGLGAPVASPPKKAPIRRGVDLESTLVEGRLAQLTEREQGVTARPEMRTESPRRPPAVVVEEHPEGPEALKGSDSERAAQRRIRRQARQEVVAPPDEAESDRSPEIYRRALMTQALMYTGSFFGAGVLGVVLASIFVS